MREAVSRLARSTQDAICAALERVEGGRFREDRWDRPGGGGGLSRVIEGGTVLEKAGVNSAVVSGPLSADAARAMRTSRELPEGDVTFFAAGVSVVIHPANPNAPTAHCNYRYFEVDDQDGGTVWWFGGGADLTPYVLFDEDAVHFHTVHKRACDAHGAAHYPRFKRWCDEYFRLPHRGEARGVGGIFFDDLAGPDREALFAFVSECAAAFVPAYLPILERRKDLPFDDDEREWQLERRGRYVEFNLLYDRGTTFGLRTGGRTESVLMSLPPLARWTYDHRPEPGSPRARLLDVLRTPRDWVG